MVAPDCGKLVDRWQQAVAVGRHHLDGKIILQEGDAQADETDSDKHQHAYRQARRQRHGAAVATPGAPRWHHRQDDGQAEADNQCKMTKLWNHLTFPLWS